MVPAVEAGHLPGPPSDLQGQGRHTAQGDPERDSRGLKEQCHEIFDTFLGSKHSTWEPY